MKAGSRKPVLRRALCALALSLCPALVSADEKTDAVRELIPWLLDSKESLTGIRFADVIAATSGKTIIPFDPADADDRRILKQIGTAMGEVHRARGGARWRRHRAGAAG